MVEIKLKDICILFELEMLLRLLSLHKSFKVHIRVQNGDQPSLSRVEQQTMRQQVCRIHNQNVVEQN